MCQRSWLWSSKSKATRGYRGICVLALPTDMLLILPGIFNIVSCPDRFFLCFGWGKRVWCNSNSCFVLNPQIQGIVWRAENNRQHWNRLSSCSLHLAQYLLRTQESAAAGDWNMKTSCSQLVHCPSNNPQNLGIQNETAIGVTPDPFSPPKTQEKAVWARDYI